MRIETINNKVCAVAESMVEVVKLMDFVNNKAQSTTEDKTTSMKKKSKKVLGSRPWTIDEDNEMVSRLIDIPSNDSRRSKILLEIAQKFGRTPKAVSIRYSNNYRDKEVMEVA